MQASLTLGQAATASSTHLDPSTPATRTYKHGISVFRSMFTLLHLLPTWSLFRRPWRPEAGPLGLSCALRLRQTLQPAAPVR
ncbi:hypothetical protein JB92DRAFT_2891309 [Gautieria morchelliformis]|nr:hypothetical protein JB92DRAFT_2891309 [Gautieria morchelliformis]